MDLTWYFGIMLSIMVGGLSWAILSYSDRDLYGTRAGLVVGGLGFTWPIVIPLAMCYGLYRVCHFAVSGKR